MNRKFSERHNELAETAFCMSHPARLVILKLLSDGRTMRFTDIRDQLNLSVATVFQHLVLLRHAKIINEKHDDVNKKVRLYYITEQGRENLRKLNKFLKETDN